MEQSCRDNSGPKFLVGPKGQGAILSGLHFPLVRFQQLLSLLYKNGRC